MWEGQTPRGKGVKKILGDEAWETVVSGSEQALNFLFKSGYLLVVGLKVVFTSNFVLTYIFVFSKWMLISL